jgi:2-polyprenyl-3-methyl-5-hydroxy-6-metoxy-1,4-benzoquinol methylase
VTSSDGRAARIAAVGFDPAGTEQETVSRCNLCGATEMSKLARVDRYGYETSFQLCGRCGLGFLSPRLTRGEYGRFYDDVYRPLVSAYNGRIIDSVNVNDDQRAYADDLYSFLLGRLGKDPETIMDVGGSTGVVGGALGRAFGAAVTVLDPAPDELAVAEAAGMETIAGFAEDHDAGGRTWDLVLLCQTVDHLLDVAATLDAIAGMIGPGGHAFVDVLDVQLMARRVGSLEGAVKVDHPFYLTRATALGFFAKAGLNVEADRLTEDNHWGFLLSRTEPAEPDWDELGRARDELLAEIET